MALAGWLALVQPGHIQMGQVDSAQSRGTRAVLPDGLGDCDSSRIRPERQCEGSRLTLTRSCVSPATRPLVYRAINSHLDQMKRKSFRTRHSVRSRRQFAIEEPP